MKALLDLFKQVQQNEQFDSIKIGLASPEKIRSWSYGEVKDAEAKTHPCLIPYDQLPEFQKAKDKLFVAIVDALK